MQSSVGLCIFFLCRRSDFYCREEFHSLQKSSYLYANLYVTTMLVEVISKYLLANKRLVVPNLGTFIVKKAGENVLFSNLIKSDDGVLRNLLVEAGISKLEAAALIDRFVFEVNYRLQSEGRCAIDGFGTFASGANGSIAFEYNTMAVGDNLEGNIPERRAQATANAKAEPSNPHVDMDCAEDTASQIVNNAAGVEQSAKTAASEDAIGTKTVAAATYSANAPQADLRTQHKTPKATAIYGDSVEASRKVRPEKYAKGLRYGKGHKVVTGRESATARRSSKGDIIIKIAILVAALAIMALMYGLYNDWQAGKIDLFGSSEQTSQMGVDNDIFEAAPDEMEGMRNPDLDYITPNE